MPAPLAGKRFDGVISTEVIEHLYDPRGFIAFAGAGRWPWLWKSKLVKARVI